MGLLLFSWLSLLLLSFLLLLLCLLLWLLLLVLLLVVLLVVVAARNDLADMLLVAVRVLIVLVVACAELSFLRSGSNDLWHDVCSDDWLMHERPMAVTCALDGPRWEQLVQ